MPDMDRAQMTRLVYDRLAREPRFRKCLTATAPDGSHPIVIVLPTDLADWLVQQLTAAGGAANVVVPALNGLAVLTMEQEALSDSGRADASIPRVRGDGTLGPLLERLRLDLGGATSSTTYRFVVTDPEQGDSAARAQLVAVAG